MKVVVAIIFLLLIYHSACSQDTLRKVPIPSVEHPIIKSERRHYEPFQPEPSFPGGYDSLQTYIFDHFDCFLKEIVQKETVVIEFTVEKDGSLTER